VRIELHAESNGVYEDIFINKSTDGSDTGNGYWELCISLTRNFSDAISMYNQEYELGMYYYISQLVTGKQGEAKNSPDL
jgi:hypothetical protein